MTKVLVIGATGLMGRPVTRELRKRGVEVHSAARRIETSSTNHPLDLAKVGEAESVLSSVQPDVVVQMTGGPDSDPDVLARINIVPTVNLILAAAGSANPPAIFITGSAAEYGDPGSHLASESSKPRPLSAYGWMKLAETATAGELGRLHDLDLTIIRPFNPVMPDLPRLTALGNFRHQLLNGVGPTRVVTCGRTNIVRDFISSDFLGKAVAELVEHPPGGIVNVCSGVGVRLIDVFNATAGLVGVDLELNEDPELMRLPAPDSIIGDPARLYSLIEARGDTTAASIASALLQSDGTVSES